MSDDQTTTKSPIEKLEGLANSLTAAGGDEHGEISGYGNIAEAQDALNKLVKAAKATYDNFFNDKSVGEDVGEGLNLIKGDSYCRFVLDEFEYYNFRYLLLNNMEEGLQNIVDEVVSAIESQVEQVSARLAQVWAMYSDWVDLGKRKEYFKAGNFSMEDYEMAGLTEGTYAYADADGWGVPMFCGYSIETCERSAGPWPNGRDIPGRLDYFLSCCGPSGMLYLDNTNNAGYIDKYRADHPENEENTWDSQLQSLHIDTSSIYEAIEKIKKIGNLISEWLKLGDEALREVSFVVHVMAFPTSPLAPNDISLYEKLVEMKDSVEPYSKKVVHALEIVGDILRDHPDADSAEKIVYVKKIVLQEINLKTRAADLCSRLMSCFGRSAQ